MKETIMMIKRKDTGYFTGQMVEYTKVSGKMENK